LILVLLVLEDALLKLLHEHWGTVLQMKKKLLFQSFFLLITLICVWLLLIVHCGAKTLHKLEFIKCSLDSSFLAS
jgi:hypothetical protein